jgi:hypothetical protein
LELLAGARSSASASFASPSGVIAPTANPWSAPPGRTVITHGVVALHCAATTGDPSASATATPPPAWKVNASE